MAQRRRAVLPRRRRDCAVYNPHGMRVVFALAALVVASVVYQTAGSAPLGFTAGTAASYSRTEQSFLALPSAERIRTAHRYLADQPHMAGTPRDLELAGWTRDQFIKYGLEDVQITTHDVLLPWPEEISVELTAPRAWRATLREQPIEGDQYTQISSALAGLPYHAYSASGEVVAPVVYAASGNPADYDRLAAAGIDVRGKVALVRYSVPYSYRGFKALTAQQRGLAGLLIYSDPADDGFAKGKVYPEGPWGPPSHIQRGGIVFDFLVPGDPLTPGWASLPGAKRIDRREAVSLPAIISAPLSYADAQVILEAMGGPEAPPEWKGALPITYRMGGAATVRLRVRIDDSVRPIWTVTGRIRGREEPDREVIVGNHRDAWIYGGVDPSSGSAALMELARTMGEMKSGGWRPRRSIVFASWDAEEFTLTSSTEWGEQHADRLRERAVAYLNVDSAASGPRFVATAVPALNPLLAEAARVVRDPELRIPVFEARRARRATEAGSLPTGSSDDLVDNRVGSGSDYTVFLNHLGVPAADLSFDGPYGVYHSIYDNHNWVATIGDPGFRYHVTLVQLWGVIAMRLAEADVIPLDYAPYASTIARFVDEVQGRQQLLRSDEFADLRAAVAEMDAAAKSLNAARETTLSSSSQGSVSTGATTAESLNRKLMQVERALLDPGGIPNRPWFRHQVYAPKHTYAPELLPGVAEALDAGDAARARQQLKVLAAAIRRAAAAMR
jgi:N-acetylated-alpha-linked acidic dipeptidase